MICPYYSKFSRICTHKGCKSNRRGKRHCIYKDQSKCQLYQEWLEIALKEKKLKIEALKRLIELSGDESDE